jgi:DNA polymerase I-like protein with 3'-5' exonuclease and polymerase domains
MQKANEIKYALIPPTQFIAELKNYSWKKIFIDYETYNEVSGSSFAVEPWMEGTKPFMFSICGMENFTVAENSLKVFIFNELTSEQKQVFREFLEQREVWSFNCKFEIAVTWKLLGGKPVLFQDVQTLFKIDGRFINNLSLKKGSELLLKIPTWADSTWDTLNALQYLAEKVQKSYILKGKHTELTGAAVKGDVRKIYAFLEALTVNKKKLSKPETEMIRWFWNAKDNLTPKLVLRSLIKAKFNPEKISLRDVPLNVVAQYCAYDSYVTAHCYASLWNTCKESYDIYIRQSWLAMMMEAYGMTRDLNRELEIEDVYKEKILYYIKEIFKIPAFADLLELGGKPENDEESESSKVESKEYVGLSFEDKQFIQDATDVELIKKKYWNFNGRGKSLSNFYNALLSSPKAKQAIQAYHIQKFIVQLEDFTEIIDGTEYSIAKRLKWNTMEQIIPLALKHIETKVASTRATLREYVGTDSFNRWSTFEDLKGREGIDTETLETLSEQYIKWEQRKYKFRECLQEAKDLRIAQDDKDPRVFIEVTKSLKKENLELLFNALAICADLSPDVKWEEMPWEMRLVFCCKVLKKLDKALTSWVKGKMGRDRVRSCNFGKTLSDVPNRCTEGSGNLFQPSFNDCSADTKRWKSPIHAIPRSSEIAEMCVPRKRDSLLLHYDYGQAEVRIIARLADEKALLALFKDNPDADVHRLMASRAFDKKPEKISDEERRASKGITFGILYGQSLETLAENVFKGNMSTAKDVYSKFFDAFPEIKRWCHEQHVAIQQKGYVKTIFGDRLWINAHSKGELLRRSQNYPVQSSSSTLAGYGIWKVYEECQRKNIEAIPQCFIHDSSDWDVRGKDLIPFIQAVEKCAVNDLASRYNIPMKIDFGIGINLNFMLTIIDPVKTSSGLKFNFKCAEIFYSQIIKRLQLNHEIKIEIFSTKIFRQSWGDLFKLKQPFSLYINQDITIYEGSIELISQS